MTDNLRQFMGHVLDIKPLYGDVVSNGIPGMAMPNMGADVTNKLRKTARLFAESYANNHDEVTVRSKADNLAGALMAAMTVGVADEKSIQALLEELSDLMEHHP